MIAESLLREPHPAGGLGGLSSHPAVSSCCCLCNPVHAHGTHMQIVFLMAYYGYAFIFTQNAVTSLLYPTHALELAWKTKVFFRLFSSYHLLSSCYKHDVVGALLNYVICFSQ